MRNKSAANKETLIKVIDLLRFILTIDDEEIKKVTIESIIDILEEIK